MIPERRETHELIPVQAQITCHKQVSCFSTRRGSSVFFHIPYRGTNMNETTHLDLAGGPVVKNPPVSAGA